MFSAYEWTDDCHGTVVCPRGHHETVWGRAAIMKRILFPKLSQGIAPGLGVPSGGVKRMKSQDGFVWGSCFVIGWNIQGVLFDRIGLESQSSIDSLLSFQGKIL